MSTNLKYFQLMQQTEKNPLRPMVARAFDIADDFKRDVERVAADRRLSTEGKREATQKHLRHAIRDLRDVQKPIEEFRKQTETMRAAIRRPAYDKTDIVAALLRRELRDASRAMSFGQRAAHLAGPTRSKAFIDAILEFEDDPWISGVDVLNPNELQIFEAAKVERLRDLHASLLDQVAERDATESEVRDLIVAVARGDLQHDSGLEGPEFEAIAKVVESKIGAPWIKKTTKLDGTEHVIVFEPGPDGVVRNRSATPDEARDGIEFADYGSYLAAQRAVA